MTEITTRSPFWQAQGVPNLGRLYLYMPHRKGSAYRWAIHTNRLGLWPSLPSKLRSHSSSAFDVSVGEMVGEGVGKAVGDVSVKLSTRLLKSSEEQLSVALFANTAWQQMVCSEPKVHLGLEGPVRSGG